MSNIYENQIISDQPFPSDPIVDNSQTFAPSGGADSSPTGNATSPTQNLIDPQIVANQLITPNLNTKSLKILKEYQFTPEGALQIGQFNLGVSGDIRISPAGIIGRNSSGITTFALDADTGDAVFQGTISGQNLLAGFVNVGNESIQIDGDNRRIVFFDGNGIPVIVIGVVS